MLLTTSGCVSVPWTDAVKASAWVRLPERGWHSGKRRRLAAIVLVTDLVDVRAVGVDAVGVAVAVFKPVNGAGVGIGRETALEVADAGVGKDPTGAVDGVRVGAQ